MAEYERERKNGHTDARVANTGATSRGVYYGQVNKLLSPIGERQDGRRAGGKVLLKRRN